MPKEARIEVDIRDIDLARRDAVVESLLQKVKAVSQQRGLQYKIEQINQDPPTACADQVKPGPAPPTLLCPALPCPALPCPAL